MSLDGIVMTFGVLAALATVALLVLKIAMGKKEIEVKWITISGATAVFLMFFQSLMFYQEPGYNVLVQYPTGGQVCHVKPGYHLKMFGNLITMKKYMTITLVKDVRFNDSVIAKTKVAARYKLSEDPELCRQTIIAYRSEANLRKATLVPETKAALRNAARLLSAQSYVSGNGGVFENAFKDQLESGLYVTERVRDNSSARAKRVAAKNERTKKVGTTDIEMSTEESVKFVVRIKLDKTGKPIRVTGPLTQYGIVVSQATVEDVDPSSKFKTKLEAQMAETAAAELERKQTKTLAARKDKEDVAGELAKTIERLAQEKEAIIRLVQSKAKRQEAKNELAAVNINEKVERKKANIVKMKADAEAYAKKKVMLADGALQQRLAAYNRAVDSMAQAIKGKQLVPSIYIAGGSGGNNTQSNAMNLVNLLLAKTAQDVGISISDKK